MEDSTDWWDHRPVFSTTDKLSRITGLAPGARPGHVTTRLLVSVLLCFLGWGAVSLLGTSALCATTEAPASTCAVDIPSHMSAGWFIAAAVVVGYLVLAVTTDLTENARQRLGQRRAAGLLRSAPLLAGMSVGAFVSAATAVAPDPSDVLRRTVHGEIGTESIAISAVVAVATGLWAVTVAVRLPSALLHARQRQLTIERLRRDGRRYAGQVKLGRVVIWLGNDPELQVTIAYDSPAGRHEIQARMRTSPDRVPADGSQVVVFDDLRGVVHVELDTAAEPAFEPEARYTPSE
ncbi:hypothetical protein EV651_101207 [Kribbella sp. VKM Ac-2571]|uniref:hypothetical protein n=1 Tax=Kribbella sp. VKM Ac-2571 TaxID=2512222 RepID=UPI00105B3496|nr:hypothetical protein [Kribbella sp. VKM Ac-2571]TDO69168.1 hypothetical protein EV651_101207 [Kribbella sp. VKM Ac-2571]